MTVPSLVAITPGRPGLALGRWLTVLGAAGLPGVILREPQATDEALTELVATARAHVGWVAVHARHPSAARCGLPVHLPASGLPAPSGPWGRSCHTEREVAASWAAGASWVTWSPVWRPTSKPDDARPPLGLPRFLAVGRGRPVLALGGVTPERFGALRRGGGWGAAVLGGLFGQATPEQAAGVLRAYLAVESNG